MSGLGQLSTLLGVEVVDVRRTRPAHERPGMWSNEDGLTVWGPARDLAGRVEREYWLVTITGACVLRLESRDVRDARGLARRLRALGSTATVDNRSAKTVLRLMHEHIEMKENNHAHDRH